MNWGKVLLGGVLGGLVMNVGDFVMHGVILGEAYTKHAVFAQEQGNPLHFFAIAICTGIAAAILFAKTRQSWSAGVGGGLTFGLFLGLAMMFKPLYNPIVIEGFPYHLGWCWGGAYVIGSMLLGAVLGVVIKR